MKKFLSLVLALVMAMSLVTISAGAKDFTDSSSITYKEAVDVVSAVKIIDGYENGSFKPGDTLTRGAAAKIICNMILGPTTASALSADAAPFKDVPASHTFAGYIAYCAKQGIISGYGDKSFRPAGQVTGFQFLKMLLGALGYDSSKEGFTGDNWSINVAKLAKSLGLYDGNDKFSGTAAMTREEACQYAFNTLNATMVEYETNSTVIVGDVTIVDRSKAKDMENKAAVETIKNDDKMQFAEKYFTDLKKSSGDSDAFQRPATVWRNKTAEIGTYSDKATAQYTAEVKVGTIYSDLGLSKAIEKAKVTVYVDGVKNDGLSQEIVKGGTAVLGGNGAQTQVFYDDEAGTVTITIVNTYVGKITATHAATSTRDAYVTFEQKTGGPGSTFETKSAFSKDDIVLYTYSNKTGDKGVQSMVKAESVTGTLTAYTVNKSVTVGGTVYNSNVVQGSKDAISGDLTNAMKTNVTVYLDTYGYAAYVDAAAAAANRAVLMGYSGANSTGVNSNKTATLLFADGTTKSVTVSIATGNALGSAIGLNDIVTYRVSSDNEYILDAVAKANSSESNTASNIITKNSGTLASLKYNKESSPATIYADGETQFVFYNGTGYSAYTGIANVPSVKLKAASTVTVYCKTGTVATMVFVNTSNADLSNNSKDVTFIKGSDSSQPSHDSELNDYYLYDAVINGEITTIKTTNKVSAYTLATELSVNSKGVYTVNSSYAVSRPGSGSTADSTNGDLHYRVGTDSAKNGTVTIGSSVLVYASDVKVFTVSADGSAISESSIGSIAKDSNDQVYYKITDGKVSTIIIKIVDETEAPVGSTSYTVKNSDIAVVEGTQAGTLKVTSTNTVISKDTPAPVSNLTLTAAAFVRDTDQNWKKVGEAKAAVNLGADGKLPAATDNMNAALTTGSYRVTLTLSGADVGTLHLGDFMVKIA